MEAFILVSALVLCCTSIANLITLVTSLDDRPSMLLARVADLVLSLGMWAWAVVLLFQTI